MGKYFLLFLLFVSSSPANAGEWIQIAKSNTALFYSAHEAVTLKPPNVIALIKVSGLNGESPYLEELVFRCDEWKVTGINYEPMLANKTSNTYIPPTIAESEIKKGTILADMFNTFCSMLYKDEKK